VAELALITEGAGFIGPNLVDALVARGSVGRVFDNLEPQPPSSLTGVSAAISTYRAGIGGHLLPIHGADRCLRQLMCPVTLDLPTYNYV